MRKLNLKNYTVKIKVPDPMDVGKTIEGEYPYDFMTSLLNLLFVQDLQLNGAELVKQNVLAMKLEVCKDDEILLEEEEWRSIKKAVDVYKGFNRNDVELVTRILEAPQIEVKQKPSQ